MADTNIEWADRVWNPVRGCALVSDGCRNCYAMKQAHRSSGPGKAYEGLTELGPKGPRWTGRARPVEEKLLEPLRRRKPARIFVNSMSDLFHEDVPFEFIDRVFAVMALCPQHTFLVLTKRPERMRDYMASRGVGDIQAIVHNESVQHSGGREPYFGWQAKLALVNGFGARWGHQWPLPHVHLGVSVENQQTADQRIPLLLETPAAIRWVSYEPALGPVDFENLKDFTFNALLGFDAEALGHLADPDPANTPQPPGLDWIVVGGESGPGARPFDIAWARQTVQQCKAAGVPVFVKQLGAQPFSGYKVVGNGPRFMRLNDRKGADMSEWPEDLRVRELLEVRA